MPTKSTSTWLLLGLAAAVLAANALIWIAGNRPHVAADWQGKFYGAAYSPYPIDGDPGFRHPTPEELRRDLESLSQYTGSLRTYSVLDGLHRIPELAADLPLTFTLGAWIDKRLERNRREIDLLVETANRNPNVTRVLVANEAVLRHDLTAAELIPYIREVRARTQVPVSTAETWGIWLEHPELVAEVDYLAIHILPYWEEGTSNANAVAHAIDKYRLIRATYPDKPVVIVEVGAPSAGRTRFDTAPALSHQAQFMRAIFNFGAAEQVEYYVMEAIDQPWKTSIEGSVGPYWGVLDAHRQPKFPFSGPIWDRPDWLAMLLASAALAIGPMIWFARRRRDLRPSAQLMYLAIIQTIASGAVWIAHVSAGEYLTILTAIPWSLQVAVLAVLVVVFASTALEFVDVLGNRRLRRAFAPAIADGRSAWPRVSIHVPVHNEPPDMVCATLDGLARLDYPDFEVIVVDNNTKDEAAWRPVEQYCSRLNETVPGRFRFFHVDPCHGFKAGALNFALARSDPAAEFIAVVDGDYVVEPRWLKATVPHFDDAKVGFVQAPQDHRDFGQSRFKQMIGWEYAGFFEIGMVQRNEADAIIQHGTMVVLRRAAIVACGNWATWCICEDAEMGLRLLVNGWRSVYVRTSLGRGLMPDGFRGYKIQRFRWAYGAVQILRRYAKDLLWGRRLTPAQRYHFAFGWAPWIADGANCVLAWLAAVWTALVLLVPDYFVLPPTSFVYPVVAVFLFQIVKVMVLYKLRVPCSLGQALGAAVAGLALTHTVGKAMLTGVFTSRRPFVRTPKGTGRPSLVEAFRIVRQESALALALWLAALATLVVHGDFDPESRIWVLLLALQSIPYLAAITLSLVSTFAQGRDVDRPVAIPAAGQPAPLSAGDE
ncbi:MAG: glycosyltransferase [Proteobacteria bacterium]|nr:glycosyltransferase [Pseudomonadota bacterium]